MQDVFITIFLLSGLSVEYLVNSQLFGSRLKYIHNTHAPRWAYEDFVSRYDKFKVKRLSKELVEESMLKMAQVEEIISISSRNIAFNTGLIMGLIQDKYKKLLSMYRSLHDKRSGRSLHFPPAYQLEDWVQKDYRKPREPLRNIHYLIKMEFARTMYKEIAHLVDVLEKTPRHFFIYEGFGPKRKGINSSGNAVLDALMVHDPVELAELYRILDADMRKTTRKAKHFQIFTTPTVFTTTTEMGYIRGPHGPPPPTRFPPKKKKNRRMMEEEYKKELRQKYLMKRLGLPEHYTTKKKRFRKDWPVEGTWSFEEHLKKK